MHDPRARLADEAAEQTKALLASQGHLIDISNALHDVNTNLGDLEGITARLDTIIGLLIDIKEAAA